MMFKINKFREILFFGSPNLNIQCLPSKFVSILTVNVKSKVGSFVYWGLFQINNIFLILPNHLLF